MNWHTACALSFKENWQDSRKWLSQASFKNGILEVRLPKTEVAKAKEIKVAVEEGPSVGQN